MSNEEEDNVGNRMNEDNDENTPRVLMQELPNELRPFEGAWAWISSENNPLILCGMRTNFGLFIQSDRERQDVIDCVAKQIRNSSWNELIETFKKNEEFDHIYDYQFQLSEKRHFLLEINLFMLGITRLSFLTQILDSVYPPTTYIESIYMLEKTLNIVVATIKSIKQQTTPKATLEKQYNEIKLQMSLKKFNDISIDELKFNYDFFFENLYNAGKKLKDEFESAESTYNGKIKEVEELTGLYEIITSEISRMFDNGQNWDDYKKAIFKVLTMSYLGMTMNANARWVEHRKRINTIYYSSSNSGDKKYMNLRKFYAGKLIRFMAYKLERNNDKLGDIESLIIYMVKHFRKNDISLLNVETSGKINRKIVLDHDQKFMLRRMKHVAKKLQLKYSPYRKNLHHRSSQRKDW